MSNNIKLKKGLDIPLAGAPDLAVKRTVMPDTVAVQPSDFKGLNPRLLVREGDRVLAGSPVLADKKNPCILVTSPVSGTVKEVVRGDKRKLLAVLIEADRDQEYLDFGASGNVSTEGDVKDMLLKSGLWAAIIQRPYGIVADPDAKPKAVFVSAFSTAPLAADTEFTLANEVSAIQAGVNALTKLAPVHVSVKSADSAFAKLSGATIHVVKGKHPAGNVGVQIANISPIHKDETVWTVCPTLLAAIGRLFKTGRYDVRRTIAVGGPAANGAGYVNTLPGIPMSALKGFYVNADGIRIISGDVLTGRNAGENGYLGFYDTQVTIIKEAPSPSFSAGPVRSVSTSTAPTALTSTGASGCWTRRRRWTPISTEVPAPSSCPTPTTASTSRWTCTRSTSSRPASQATSTTWRNTASTRCCPRISPS